MAGPSGAKPNVNFKTGSLQQSDNYIWNTADILGKGATAIVYFGRHKVSGDVCAVKVFHDRGSHHLFVVQKREVETLRSLNHRNVVRLLALEQEQTSRNNVLVMEYCSGGSVYNMLEQPQYGYGFPEAEFLIFIGHISSGMAYLRSKGYIHRDIKPGNIMRYIGEDGLSVYKLTDFGAARELQDDETFMSIYGTEEYLYPQMYQRAVLRDSNTGNQRFDASVDLWSIGVTFYHVATGKLPFLPFEGRANAATMFYITSKKPSGVISGVQEQKNGPVIWSSELPNTCLLSDLLQKDLVGLLSGLMEADPSKMWPAERFFATVEFMCNKVSVTVFLCNTAHFLTLYLNKTDRFAQLQEKLAEVSDIPASFQLLLWTDRELSEVIDLTTEVQSYPRTVLKSPLFLLNRQVPELKLRTNAISSYTEIRSGVDVDRDAQVAKKTSCIAHYICTNIGIVLEQQDLLGQADHNYRRFIKRIVQQCVGCLPDLKRAVQETGMRLSAFFKTYQVITKLLEKIEKLGKASSAVSRTQRELSDLLHDKQMVNFQEKIEGRVKEIEVYISVLSDKISEQERDAIMTCVGCLEEDHCLPKAENLKTKIVTVTGIMMKHRKYKDLHQHEIFIHECEKQKLQEYSISLVSIYQDHCLKNLQLMFNVTGKQISLLTKHLARTKKVEQNIQAVIESQQQLSRQLLKLEEDCRTVTLKATDYIGDQPAKFLSSKGVPEKAGYERDEKARSAMLQRLTTDLMKLKDGSSILRTLADENTEMLKRFLAETSNLEVEGSLEEDFFQKPLAIGDT